MLRRLFIVLQIVGVIPIIIFWFVWLIQNEGFWWTYSFPFWLVSSHFLYLLSFLGKYIVYGKLQLFKIGQDIKPKKRERENKDEEWQTEWKN